MKYLKEYKIFEHYASDRMKRSRYEKWSELSDSKKYEKYDAEGQFKKITKKWDKGVPSWTEDESYWSIREYLKGYTKSVTKAVHLSATSDLLNRWKLMEDDWKYTKGVEKKFSKWLKQNNYDISWDSEHNGIYIIPHYEGLYWYYEELAGVKPDLARDRKVRPDKNNKDIEEIIRLFKKNGFNVTEPPDSITNDGEYRDRYEFNYEYDNMTIRFYLLKNNSTPFIRGANPAFKGGTTYKNAVKQKIIDFEQHILRYSEDIKYVYEYCKDIAEGDLWSMPGGGAQLQQFYGDDDGYICILYMGMRNDPNDDSVCFVQSEGKNEKKFKNFDDKPLKEIAKLRNTANKYNI